MVNSRSRDGDEDGEIDHRAAAMSPGPGRIDLKRPRDIASAEFNEWRRMLSSQLHSHHARKAG
jgi:NitT/TauT family transport system ATP-binding protein